MLSAMIIIPYMSGCQNYGPFLGTLNIRCRTIIGIQNRTINLTTTHIPVGNPRPRPTECLRLLGPTRVAIMAVPHIPVSNPQNPQVAGQSSLFRGLSKIYLYVASDAMVVSILFSIPRCHTAYGLGLRKRNQTVDVLSWVGTRFLGFGFWVRVLL